MCLFGLNSLGFGSRAEETAHFYKIPTRKETSALSTKAHDGGRGRKRHYLLSKSRKKARKYGNTATQNLQILILSLVSATPE